MLRIDKLSHEDLAMLKDIVSRSDGIMEEVEPWSAAEARLQELAKDVKSEDSESSGNYLAEKIKFLYCGENE